MSIDRRTAMVATGAAAASLVTGGAAAGPVKGAVSRSTMGLIALEEHCLPPELRPDWERTWNDKSYGKVAGPLADISGRLADMDRYGIQMMVLSLTAAGPQGEGDPATARDMARRGNDAIASIVSRRHDRLAAFGCLAMQDVDAACKEFERAVRELGLKGVLLNNYQRNGPDPDGVLFYDAPQYDAFWSTAERLGVPVYLHPNYATPTREQDFTNSRWLRGAIWDFAVQTGTHALKIITSGVFDRYPGAQLVLGHCGEHVVVDLWRMDHWLGLRPWGNASKLPIRSYFRSNVSITTSGQFTTPLLKHCIAEIGADRILFSVDSPYEQTGEGAPWFRSADISDDHFKAIGRGNALRLLNLGLR